MKQGKRGEGDRPIMCEEISSTFERNVSNINFSFNETNIPNQAHVNQYQRHYTSPRGPGSYFIPKCMCP